MSLVLSYCITCSLTCFIVVLLLNRQNGQVNLGKRDERLGVMEKLMLCACMDERGCSTDEAWINFGSVDGRSAIRWRCGRYCMYSILQLYIII